ncbi:MAG TPA: 2-phospho-L-lactate guanylyltransferase [Hyphomicrobiaceae bacterium]|jgi:2-phospho-L-lactate guanylyltransferase
MRTLRNKAPWVIVPIKALADAKQRLAAVLAPETRRRLMVAMLQDVLATLHQVADLGPVLVVTPDARVAELAQRCGVRVLREARGQGHSAAVAAGFAHARTHGAVQALTLPGDAPCVTCGEVEDLIDTGDRIAVPGVVMVPARDGDGTNALLVAPPGAFPPSFGPGSFARHRAEAEARGLDCRVLPLAGIGLDIDEPRDLRALLAFKRDDPNYAFLQHAASAEEIRP